jgi:hypothetical protein
MSKRVQVTLSDEEYGVLQELSELRGESMSLILGETVSTRLLWQWRHEIAARIVAQEKFEAAQRQLEAKLSKQAARG